MWIQSKNHAQGYARQIEVKVYMGKVPGIGMPDLSGKLWSLEEEKEEEVLHSQRSVSRDIVRAK